MKRESTKSEKKEMAFVEVLNMNKFEKNNLRAFCTIRVNNVCIKDVRLMEFKKGDFTVDMPSSKGKDKDGNEKWYPNVWFDFGSKDDNREVYELITKAVLEEYDK